MDHSVRVHSTAFTKLSKFAEKYDIPKKRMLETFIHIGAKLCSRMNGYHNLILDERLAMKFYLDKDTRDEVSF